MFYFMDNQIILLPMLCENRTLSIGLNANIVLSFPLCLVAYPVLYFYLVLYSIVSHALTTLAIVLHY